MAATNIYNWLYEGITTQLTSLSIDVTEKVKDANLPYIYILISETNMESIKSASMRAVAYKCEATFHLWLTFKYAIKSSTDSGLRVYAGDKLDLLLTALKSVNPARFVKNNTAVPPVRIFTATFTSLDVETTAFIPDNDKGFSELAISGKLLYSINY